MERVKIISIEEALKKAQVGPYTRIKRGKFERVGGYFRAEGINAEAVQKFNSEIKAPFVHTQYSTLGGVERASMIVTISYQEKKDWTNNILQNSPYAMFHLGYDGVLEQFSRGMKVEKFRKTRVKDVDEAIDKINGFLRQHYAAESFADRPPEEASVSKVRQAYDIQRRDEVIKRDQNVLDYIHSGQHGLFKVLSIDEEFQKSRVKGFVRTRKGHLERVGEFERKGGKGKVEPKKLVSDIKRALRKEGMNQAHEETTTVRGYHRWSNDGYTVDHSSPGTVDVMFRFSTFGTKTSPEEKAKSKEFKKTALKLIKKLNPSLEVDTKKWMNGLEVNFVE